MPATKLVRGQRTVGVLKLVVFTACLLPTADLVRRALTGGLGANPLERVTHTTGDWALNLLVLTLAITPLRRVTGWNPIIRFRRMTGLFAFFYGSLHLLTYLWFDQFFSVSGIAADIVKRPFITVGAATLTLLAPLAATSTAGMIRRLGGKAWQRLHRLVYVAAVLAVVHYWWLVKADITWPRRYAVIVGLLLGFRVVDWWLRWRRRRP